MKYTKTYYHYADDTRSVDKYINAENQIEIVVERTSFSGNAITGYTLTIGSVELSCYQTLGDAKDRAEWYLRNPEYIRQAI